MAKQVLAVLIAASLLLSCATAPPGGPASHVDDGGPAGDIAVLYGTLAANHRDFFNTVGEDDAAALALGEIAKADPEDPASFFWSLNRVAALARDSHTAVSASEEIASSLDMALVRYKYFGGELVITAVGPGLERLLGEEVSSICGTPLYEVEEAAEEWVSHDNSVQFQAVLAGSRLIFPSFLETTGLKEEGSAYTVSTKGGVLAEIPVVGWEEAAEAEWSTLRRAAPPTLNPTSPYSAMYLSDPEAILVNYHVCADWGEYPFASFTRDVSALIRGKGYRKVVIDLRYNTGGDSSVISPLVDALAEIKEERGLEVYVLIGEGTFSSAVLNAHELKRELGAVLVGTPTGGSGDHYGEVRRGTLPWSGCSFFWSTKYFRTTGPGPLMPDVYVRQSVEDWANGVDSELKALGMV